ncbi:MAG: hypothetical protein VX909_01025 [Candidatus Thermoplasmatota archaeon]|nr:hypothetical protein [Candidatus Thermoplasmatota archaeon]
MALVIPPPVPGNIRPTLRISEIISALKNREYDEGALGELGGFREGRTFPGPHGNPGATSVTFRHDCQNRGSRAIRVPHGVVPQDDFWNRLESVSGFVSRHNSAGHSLPIVDFEIHRDAIWPDSKDCHVMTMPWVEGRTIHSCARDLAEKREHHALKALAYEFEEMGKQFQASPFDHGDISGGNIMVTTEGSLRIIDPDTLRHEEIPDPDISEVGHVSFAHTKRSGIRWEDDLFRFPLEVIIVSLEALVEDPSLVDRYGDDDSSLLFDQQDLADPMGSELFRELCGHYDDSISKRASRLRDAAAADSVTEANRILGSFRSPKPLPLNPVTLTISPMKKFVPPESRMASATRRAKLPMRIPDVMRRGEDEV